MEEPVEPGEPPQENESRTVIGLFRERNVCRFEAAAWGRGTLRDSGPSGCEGDYTLSCLSSVLKAYSY